MHNIKVSIFIFIKENVPKKSYKAFALKFSKIKNRTVLMVSN